MIDGRVHIFYWAFSATPPSIQKFDLEDMGKLVAIVAESEMTREYLIKQKILPDSINV